MTSAHTHAGPAAGSATWRLVAWPLAFALAVLVAYHVALTASTVGLFGLRYPFQDQFRLNLRYLTEPFPASVLALENGHRPIVPGLVRIAELRWLGGAPWLQALTAWLAAGVAFALTMRAAARDLRGHPLLLTAAACAVGSLLFWNANARMFIHAYEAVHVFYMLLFVVLAVTLALRAVPGRVGRYAPAIGACIAATFTFGPGIAAFAALFAAAWLRRTGAGVLMTIGACGALSFALYTFGLPGADGVRAASSAFSVSGSVFLGLARIGAVVAEALRVSAVDAGWAPVCAAIAGAAATAAIAVSIVGRRARRARFSDTEVLGAALFAFGATVNVLLAVNRAGYFLDYPGQLFADRYLFWSCVTWAGIALYGLARMTTAPMAGQCVAATVVGLAAVAAIAPATWAHGWASEVYRVSEVSAAAMRVGIRDDAELRVMPEDGVTPTPLALDAFLEYRVCIFAARDALRLGANLALAPATSLPSVPAAQTPVAARGDGGERARKVSAWLTADLAARAKDADLWLAAEDGVLRGRAALASIGGPPNALLLGSAPFVVVEGYALGTPAGALILVAARGDAVTPLARLDPPR